MAGDVAVVKRLVPRPEHGRPRTVVVAAVTGVVVAGTCSERHVRCRGFMEIFGVKFGDQGQVPLCRLGFFNLQIRGCSRAHLWGGCEDGHVGVIPLSPEGFWSVRCAVREDMCVCVRARVDVCASRVTPARPAVTLLQPQLSKSGKDNEKL